MAAFVASPREIDWSAAWLILSIEPSKVITELSVEDSPINPIRHTFPARGPKPPPTSI